MENKGKLSRFADDNLSIKPKKISWKIGKLEISEDSFKANV